MSQLGNDEKEAVAATMGHEGEKDHVVDTAWQVEGGKVYYTMIVRRDSKAFNVIVIDEEETTHDTIIADVKQLPSNVCVAELSLSDFDKIPKTKIEFPKYKECLGRLKNPLNEYERSFPKVYLQYLLKSQGIDKKYVVQGTHVIAIPIATDKMNIKCRILVVQTEVAAILNSANTDETRRRLMQRIDYEKGVICVLKGLLNGQDKLGLDLLDTMVNALKTFAYQLDCQKLLVQDKAAMKDALEAYTSGKRDKQSR